MVDYAMEVDNAKIFGLHQAGERHNSAIEQTGKQKYGQMGMILRRAAFLFMYLLLLMLLLDGKQFNKYLYFGRSLYCFILTFYNIEAVEDFLGASQTEVKKITRLVIVFGGHEVLLQNY